MPAPRVPRSGLILTEPHRLIGLWLRIFVLVAVALVPITLELMRIEAPWRLDWFDMLTWTLPREAVQDSPVRVVVLQDAAGGERLQGTWPRDQLARLVDRIGDSGAKAIGLDVPLDGVGIYEHVEAQAAGGITLAKTQALADAVRKHPVIAPVTLYENATGSDSTSPMQAVNNTDTALNDALEKMPDLQVLPVSVPAHPIIAASAQSKGMLIDDLHSDERLRQVPVIRVHGRDGKPTARHDALAVEMIRTGLGLPRPEIERAFLSDRVLRLDNNLRVPIDAHGAFRLFLSPWGAGMLVDGNAVLRQTAKAEQFRDRYVIITRGYGDFSGRIDTSVLRFATTGEITAQIIEQILTERFLYRPSWMPWAEIVLMVLIGCFPVFLFSRYAPARIVPVCMFVGLLIPAACATLFVTTGIMIDALGLVAGLTIVALFALGTNLVDRDQDYLVANLSLIDTQAAKARLEGELDVARRIQMSLLPPQQARFPGGLELACNIEPAQEVGGDFYDYVERPDGQVFFSIGDVSGKGVPASLFMALSKSLWKSAALINSELSDLQEQANRDISRDNRDVMFVTGVGCLFDPATRSLRYCGAGHDMPVLARKGETPVTLGSSSGPPLGLDNGRTFPAGKTMLEPGDLICLFTDGFTEAELSGRDNPGFFGVKGILAAMQDAANANATASQALHLVLSQLEHQTAGSPQTDDRTIVVARYDPA